MNAVKENMPVLHAAQLYNVPKSTLHDRVSGKVQHGDKHGPRPYFSALEETEMANFLVDVAQAGMAGQEKKYEV